MKSDFDSFLNLFTGIGLKQVVSRGTILQRQFEPVKTLSIITSGTAIANAYTAEGNVIWLDDFAVGEMFGFELWIGSDSASYEVTAKTELRLLSFSKAMLLQAIDLDPLFCKNLLSQVIIKYQVQTNRLIETSTLSSPGRICAELKRQCKPIGKTPDTHIIRPTPVFSEFALRVGSTRESVSRTVSELTKSGILLRKTGALLIPDLERLEARIR